MNRGMGGFEYLQSVNTGDRMSMSNSHSVDTKGRVHKVLWDCSVVELSCHAQAISFIDG